MAADRIKNVRRDEFGWRIVDFKDWQDQPDGTIFIIDECHNDLPLRPSSSKVPKEVSMLAEHRKRGFDFFLLTQHPRNIDGFVRNLIQAPGYHQHFKRVFGGTKYTSVLQWDAVNLNCEKTGSGNSAQVERRSQWKRRDRDAVAENQRGRAVVENHSHAFRRRARVRAAAPPRG